MAHDPRLLTGRWALVTGAGRRVGRALALELANAGADLILHARQSAPQARALAQEIEGLGRRAVVLVSDLADPAGCQQLAAETLAATDGRLDIMVHNAALFEPTPVSLAAAAWAAGWTRHLAVNLAAPALLSHHFAPALTRAKGVIIALADVSWDRPWKDHAAYSASKAGLVSLMLSLARDLAPAVRVNAVLPGVVEWPPHYDAATRERLLRRIPLGRAGTPEDVARAVRFLAESPYLTGVLLPVDGGRRLT